MNAKVFLSLGSKMETKQQLPLIIQGGMGVGVSNWELAKAVSKTGHLGVVSGTALDSVIARRLQDGDPDGNIQRAFSHFPIPEMAEKMYARFYRKSARKENENYKLLEMHTANLSRDAIEMLIVANFTEIYLAKENHDGIVGINYLEKIQLPTLPSILGAMLAGVDYILMGAGIPSAIPGIIDNISKGEPCSMALYVEQNKNNQDFKAHLTPKEFLPEEMFPLKRPEFLGIISSDIVAKTMVRKATGKIAGFVVENYTAGGHNAPPRKNHKAIENDAPSFSERDNPNLENIKNLGLPFWLAGGFNSHEKLQEALGLGATGIQLGSLFAFCNESGMKKEVKTEVLNSLLTDTFKSITDFKASPTGYPFKLASINNKIYEEEIHLHRERICDLGLLRTPFVNEAGNVGFKCPSEPEKVYVKKGGTIEETVGRKCLCNGLMAAIGLDQPRKDYHEPSLVTAGEDITPLKIILKDKKTYSAQDVIDYVLVGICH
jgi:nitronate monooxygenase